MTERLEVRVLLVEDNPSDVLTMKEYLSDQPVLDFKVHEAERLSEALAFLREQTCEVILLDLGLPDSQGIETLVQVRAQTPVPVLVLTGLNDEGVGVQALQAGAQDFLVKNQTQGPLLGRAIRYAMERHRMEDAIVRAEKMQALGTLAGGIAHDFNNILLVVSGNAKLALEELPPDHSAHSNVLEIAKASSRGSALTKKILSFSRQQEIRRQPMQLQPVVEEALSQVRPSLPPQVEIRKHFGASLPPILADASQIQQIITNLVSNAADAIGDAPGQIEISACPLHLNGNGTSLSAKLPPGDYVKLSVRDTGPGMDKPTLARAFEPFFTTKPQGRGTGMGLAIVHGIAKNHFGEVTTYSEVGKGTVFNLYLPACQDRPVELPVTVLPIVSKGQRILYVDDEEPLVLLITRTLERLGYEVVGLTDPLEALRTLRHTPCDFHALVTDLSMPQMSGIDLAQEALQVCPRLPVVLTTGYIRPQDQEQARRIGVRELVLKPDTAEELGEVLHRLLGGTEDKPGQPAQPAKEGSECPRRADAS
jgi:signal transduction histidine kinase